MSKPPNVSKHWRKLKILMNIPENKSKKVGKRASCKENKGEVMHRPSSQEACLFAASDWKSSHFWRYPLSNFVFYACLQRR